MTLVRLVYLPGEPAINSLCPKSALLEGVGQLCEAGFQTDLQHLGEVRSHGEALISETPRVALTPAEAVSGLPAAALTVFYAESRGDYEQVRKASLLLAKYHPETTQLLAGPFAVHFATCALADLPVLDGAISDHLSATLPQAALYLLGGQKRPDSGDLSFQENGGKAVWKRRAAFTTLSPFVSRRRCEKNNLLQYYPLSFSEGPCAFFYQDKKCSQRGSKSAALLFNEIKWLHESHDATVFHIDIQHVASEEVEELAQRLLDHNLMILYSLGNATQSFSRTTARLLLASGCRSIGFRIPTGSQRILEDFYGMQVSISAMQSVLRLCRDTGLQTVLHLTGPCPIDDIHSTAETVRFLEDAHPHSVTLSPLAVVPHSLWFCQPRRFGLSFSYKHYQKQMDPFRLPLTLAGKWNRHRLAFVNKVIQDYAFKAGLLFNADERSMLLLRLLGIEGVSDSSRFLQHLSRLLESNDAAGLSDVIQKFNHRATVAVSRDAAAMPHFGQVAISR
ncbi:MAG: hypothetical protein BWY07_00715 [Candidatus Hydrogenedentes bacterium ADurb.Bin170]|jgi:hypothetical protein|nr:MAG: hypothetical protein BWY07_00715 [Candidatus Hydrogenedentes bacterium ADurb.Bin170]